jgi:hypothetical protein
MVEIWQKKEVAGLKLQRPFSSLFLFSQFCEISPQKKRCARLMKMSFDKKSSNVQDKKKCL